jgi:hypothetical protein
MIGKVAISFYIGKSNVKVPMEQPGSLVVLLLWVYYSAIISCIWAEFAKPGVLIKVRHRLNDYAVALKWNGEG